MLKTTYKPASSNTKPALPSGWTEHKAPSGHLYYYNAETKQSTYTRPTDAPKESPRPPPSTAGGFDASNHFSQTFPSPIDYGRNQWNQRQNERQSNARREVQRRPPPQDRPKHKQNIPGAEPWLLIQTKLKRRFVHNPETGESLWKFPKDVMKSVLELDAAERESRHRREQGISTKDDKDGVADATAAQVRRDDSNASDEYEEVEDSEDEEDEESTSKRPRTGVEGAPNGPVEFGEDDIAFQLAQMEADEGGSENEYYEEDEPLLSDDDARALFKDLLDDFKISPFSPWETVIAEGRIIDDDRYTVLGSMKARKEVFDEWSRTKVSELKEQRERQAQQDPRIPYMAFLAAKATPKLYWQEFRRKYQREPEMKDRKLADKDKEKWYRDHISRLKLPESDRKKDLRRLLEEISVRELNRSTSIASLPGSLLRDLRYISLPAKVRDPLIEAFIEIAPAAPEESEDIDPQQEELLRKGRLERERRQKALADRERAVREQKEKQRRELGYSKGVLREEQAELHRAMLVGREGLLSHLEGEGSEPGPSAES